MKKHKGQKFEGFSKRRLPKAFPIELVTWRQAHRLACRLAANVAASNYKPEIIVAIARGGLFPALILSDALLQKNLACFKIEHGWLSATKPQRARILYPLNAKIKGKRVLVVEDVADTGETLALALRHLRRLDPKELRIAVLDYKTTSRIVPDYFARRVAHWRWIAYPWVERETLLDLGWRAYVKGMTSMQLAKALQQRHGIKITPSRAMALLCELQQLRHSPQPS